MLFFYTTQRDFLCFKEKLKIKAPVESKQVTSLSTHPLHHISLTPNSQFFLRTSYYRNISCVSSFSLFKSCIKGFKFQINLLTALRPRLVLVKNLGIMSLKFNHQGRQCPTSLFVWEGRDV